MCTSLLTWESPEDILLFCSFQYALPVAASLTVAFHLMWTWKAKFVRLV